jgi:predicted patatin/cPLA2 family phospholipase
MVDLRRIKKIIDVDYLIDEIFKKQDSLDEKKIHRFEGELLLSATNAKTGKIKYFSNKTNVNFFEVMRASMAMPLVYGKLISIGGKEFCDTPSSSFVELNILKAIELGAKEILVIDNSHLDYLTKFGFETWLLSQNKEFRKNYHKQAELRNNSQIPKKIEISYLLPSRPLNIGILDNKKRHLRKTFGLGERDARKFLKKSTK